MLFSLLELVEFINFSFKIIPLYIDSCAMFIHFFMCLGDHYLESSLYLFVLKWSFSRASLVFVLHVCSRVCVS